MTSSRDAAEAGAWLCGIGTAPLIKAEVLTKDVPLLVEKQAQDFKGSVL